MTIDELFNMPIFQMKEWLTENYRDPIGTYKGESWNTNDIAYPPDIAAMIAVKRIVPPVPVYLA